MKSIADVPVTQQPKVKSLPSEKDDSSTDFRYELSKEKKTYEAELAISLSEVEEFKDLMQRFPKQNDLFKPFYLETRERSVQLLGKVNALTKVLNIVDLAA
nr:Putative uncharacterized protein [Moritella viscosa]